MTYALVVVTHRSRMHLERLLDSLERLPERPPLVVVDTGPDDGGARLAGSAGARVWCAGTTPASARPTTWRSPA